MKRKAMILTSLGVLGIPFLVFADMMLPSPSQLLPFSSIGLSLPPGEILVFDLIANSVIVFALIPHDRFRKLFRGYSILKIMLLTFLGLIADLVGAIGSIIVTSLFAFSLNPNKGGDDINHFAFTIIWGLIAWFLVALNFYWIYSKETSDQKRVRVIKAIIFGFISNPFWLSLIF